MNIPPFFVFTKGTKGRDVVFLGLAVPGAVGVSSLDSLKIVEHKKSEGTIQNYEVIFTILDVRTISRAWIEDLHRGEPMTENAPVPWVNWIKTGEYTPLIERVDYSLSNASLVRDTPHPLLNQSEVPTHIHSYIKSKGFNYSLEDINNLYLSIKTKPFVILSGISGTGKTKIVQWLAESVGATEENKQFTLIPVRPDWNDGSDLLGFVDIKGEFKPGPLTKVIEEAEKHPNLPFFVLLDEMNLARVEHYFSDMLSVMESRKWKDGKMVTTPLLTEETAKKNITLPSNVYVLGTVNMDETTHPFSKKVLDRANTIEFNTVELSNLTFLEDLDEVEPIKASNSMFLSDFLHLKDIYLGNEEFVRKVTKELENINSILQPTNLHFGYRVRDEISFYLYYNEINGFLTYEEAFDFCILQKILPRLSGSDQRTEEMLQGLYKLFTGREYSSRDEKDIEEAMYSKSANKVVEMLRRLQDGFTSFWIS